LLIQTQQERVDVEKVFLYNLIYQISSPILLKIIINERV